MIRTTFLAAAAALLSTGAFAQTAFNPGGPRLVDEAYSPRVVYDAPSANVVGSALATVTGSPSSSQYVTLRVFRTQSPSIARDPSQIEVDSSN